MADPRDDFEFILDTVDEVVVLLFNCGAGGGTVDGMGAAGLV
jgi:hypothetical protein